MIEAFPETPFKTFRIFSSDLSRAADTARLIHKNLSQKFDKRIELQISPLLREQHSGQLQGITLEEFHSRTPDAAKAYEDGMLREPNYARAPGPLAESKIDVAYRLNSLILNTLGVAVTDQIPELHIWCGHGWTINVILDMLGAREPNEDGYIGNGDVLLLSLDQRTEPFYIYGSELKVEIGARKLKHIEVGERGKHISFIRKSA